MITAEQVRAARGWLKWSQTDLAAATDLSPQTIHNLERGECISPRRLKEVRSAFEKEGFEFSDSASLRRQPNEARVYTGPRAADLFYNDILDSIDKTGGDVGIVIRDERILNRSLGALDPQNSERLEVLAKLGALKVLLWETGEHQKLSPKVNFRQTSRPPYAPLFVALYGKKLAITISHGPDFCFHISTSLQGTSEAWNDFNSCWMNGVKVNGWPS